MKRYNINSKIFTGTVGNGKTTNIINELQKLIEEYPDIKIYVYEEYPEISSEFQNGNIRDILSEEIDLVIIGATTEYNIPLELIKPYIFRCSIWLELNTKMNIDIHKSSMKEENIRCVKEYEYHSQLVELLEELKAPRETGRISDRIRIEIENVRALTDVKKSWITILDRANNNICNPALRATVLRILIENEQAFLTEKGSDWEHHNYPGGLAVHTCNVLKNALRIVDFYSSTNPNLSSDLVVFGAILHDIGKVPDYRYESTFANSNKNTPGRALLGHDREGICYVNCILREEMNNWDCTDEEKELIIAQCLHMIAAHMFNPSSMKWQMLEVMIIGFSDWLDAYVSQSIIEDKDDTYIMGCGEEYYRAAKSIQGISWYKT